MTRLCVPFLSTGRRSSPLLLGQIFCKRMKLFGPALQCCAKLYSNLSQKGLIVWKRSILREALANQHHEPSTTFISRTKHSDCCSLWESFARIRIRIRRTVAPPSVDGLRCARQHGPKGTRLTRTEVATAPRQSLPRKTIIMSQEVDVLITIRKIIRATDLYSRQLSKKSGLTAPQLPVSYTHLTLPTILLV